MRDDCQQFSLMCFPQTVQNSTLNRPNRSGKTNHSKTFEINFSIITSAHFDSKYFLCFVSAMKSIAPAVGRSSGSIENLSSRLFSGDWDQRAERMAPLYLILSISATNWTEEKNNDSTLIHECHWWIHQCTMWLSTQLELSEICKSKGLVFAQFSPKSDNSTFDWWKTLKNLLKKYSNQIFTKNVIFIGKKSVAGVWQSGNLAHN